MNCEASAQSAALRLASGLAEARAEPCGEGARPGDAGLGRDRGERGSITARAMTFNVARRAAGAEERL